MNRAGRKHKPAAVRKTGFKSSFNLILGFCAALIWAWFVSRPMVAGQFGNFGENGLLTIRFLLLGLAVSSILFFFAIGSHRYAFFHPIKYDIYQADLALAYVCGFALLISLFWGVDGIWSLIWRSFFAFIVPFGLLLLFPFRDLILEYAKESPYYRRWFILGKGGASARVAGMRSFLRNDLTHYVTRKRHSIPKYGTSDIYLGRTRIEDDMRIGGRDIGIIASEQHFMTVAGIGAGKSRDMIFNNLLTYAGGVCAFDMKGEIFRVTHDKRRTYGAVHVLDPYGEVSDICASGTWNPLDEVDPNEAAAREKLQNIAKASIFVEGGTGGISDHFQESAQIIMRGFMAHVITSYPEEDRHLGTVYDLFKRGASSSEEYTPEGTARLMVAMSKNMAVSASPRDAASLLMAVSDKERGSMLSTIARGIDWINAKEVRKVLCGKSTFSLSEAKSKESSIYLVLPEMYVKTQARFLRTFYSIAFDMCDNHITPQPRDSKRRVLFLFDEFNVLGRFKPAEDAVSTKRGSFVKCWFVVQNVGQFFKNYDNTDNFFTSCDKQFFGIDLLDTKAPEMISKALGQYTEKRGGGSDYKEESRAIMTESDIAEALDAEGSGQLVIPIKGLPMRLVRRPYFKNFPPDTYGHHKH